MVERDRVFLRDLGTYAEDLGWELLVLPSVPTAEVLLSRGAHALIVDIELLGPRWEKWLARHPARVPRLGVIVCTGRSSTMQRIRGLRAGADDWVTKPCPAEEVVARVIAVVRAYWSRASTAEAFPLRSADLEVRPDLYDAFVDGHPVGLTRREFEVLLCLAREEGQVVNRSQIYREVWHRDGPENDRALDTAVRKIRSKLKRASPARSYIQTHHGIGYRFSVERAQW